MPFKRLAVAGLAGLLGMTRYALAQSAPSLGEAASFAVLAGASVRSSGTTTISGNVGVSPGTTVSGSPIIKVGSIRNDLAGRAQADAAAAYAALAAPACSAPPGDIIPPGVYCVSQLARIVTLDARGDKGAVWIFHAASLATAAGTLVRVTNGGHERNVFWQVAQTATLGAQTTFVGNILALGGITLGNGATLSGRALALAPASSVTLDNNKVSLCCESIALAPATLPNGSVGKQYSATIAASGGLEPYTYAWVAAIPDLTPSGATLSGIPTVAGSYSVTATATDALGCSITRDYTVTVEIECSTIVVLPSATPPTPDIPFLLPSTAIGSPYSQMFSAACVTPPYKCSLTDGPLPSGLALTNCTLAGSPSAAGTFDFTISVTDDIHPAGHQRYRVVVCGITLPPALPDGCVGAPYDATIKGAAVVFSGDIPPELTPDGNALKGVPTKEGCFDVVATVTDAGCVASRQYRICIRPPLVLDPTPLPPACLGMPYNRAIKASGCFPPYLFSFDPETALGLGGTPGGAIAGAAMATGIAKFTVTVTDSAGNTATAKYEVSVKAIDIAPAVLPPATPGVPYFVQIIPSGGTAPYTLTYSGVVPYRLTFSTVTGIISGLPRVGGLGPQMMPVPPFTVTATDANGCTGSRTYTPPQLNCPQITMAPPTLSGGNIGSLYGQAIIATGGTSPYSFNLISGSLPPGLTLASDGTLAGTPTVTGTYCFLIAARDAGNCVGGPIAYTLVISAATCPPGTIITLSPPALPFAPTGAPYSQMITASGGTAPYTFSVSSGALPPGLTLNAVTGVVSGTPTMGGSYAFAITATDANGCVGSMGCGVVMGVDIPALSGWGLLLLSAIIAVMGTIVARKGGI